MKHFLALKLIKKRRTKSQICLMFKLPLATITKYPTNTQTGGILDVVNALKNSQRCSELRYHLTLNSFPLVFTIYALNCPVVLVGPVHALHLERLGQVYERVKPSQVWLSEGGIIQLIWRPISKRQKDVSDVPKMESTHFRLCV